MKKIFIILFAGFGISLLGTLPLGTLNTISIQIALTQNNCHAGKFAAGVAVTEMIYLLLTLYAASWIQQQKKLLFYANWITVALFVAIAVNALYKAFFYSSLQNVGIITGAYFLNGLLLNSINTAQFPFWMGWNTVLFSKKILSSQTKVYLAYIIGAGLGGFAGLCIFIAAASLLQNNHTLHQKHINLAVGIVFIICAFIQGYKNIGSKKQVIQ